MKDSFQKMKAALAGTHGGAARALILLMIPILMISLFSAYMAFRGYEVHWEKAAVLTPEQLLTDPTAMDTGLQSVIVTGSEDITVHEVILSVLAFLLATVLDTFLILSAACSVSGVTTEGEKLLLASLKRLLPMVFFELLLTWIITLVQDLIASGLGLTAYLWVTMGPMMGLSAAVGSLGVLAGSLFLGAWIIVKIGYDMISLCGRNMRMLSALAYGREVLRGHIFKEMTALMPWLAGSVIVPAILGSLAQFLPGGMALRLSLLGASTLLQVLLTGLTWFWLMPRYAYWEEAGGIPEKIRQLMRQAERRPGADDNERNEGNDNEGNDNEGNDENDDERNGDSTNG